MRTIIWGKTFLRDLKRTIKKNPTLRDDIENTLRLLAGDPFASQLSSHKLKGQLAGSWACNVGYDLRIVSDFVESEDHKEDDIHLLAIGTHNEVY